MIASRREGDDQCTKDSQRINKGIQAGSVGEIAEPELDEINRSGDDDKGGDDDQEEYLLEEDEDDVDCGGSVYFTDGNFLGPEDSVEGGEPEKTETRDQNADRREQLE